MIGNRSGRSGSAKRGSAETRRIAKRVTGRWGISSLVLVEGGNVDVELVRDEGQKFSRRRFTGFQCAAGMPVAKQDWGDDIERAENHAKRTE